MMKVQTEEVRAMDIPRLVAKKRSVWWWRSFAIVALVGVTLGLSRLKAAAPSVERANLWIGTVKRGEMLREVRGAGTLVPEDIRWMTAVVSARVERIELKPGAKVSEGTVVLELSNPDLKLAALEAEQQLSSAKAELTHLEAEQNSQTLAQRSALATLSADQKDAERRARADSALAEKGFLSDLELQQSKGKADELVGRLQFENERLTALDRGTSAQLSAQRAQVERMQAIAELRREQVAELRITAPIAGVLQEVGVQVGQWVTPGTLLAKVADPNRLKAEVKVPELSARDVAVGQSANIDTRNGIVAGHVQRVDPSVTQGTVRVDVVFDAALPSGSRADQNIEGAIARRSDRASSLFSKSMATERRVRVSSSGERRQKQWKSSPG
jgi:multidrug resistance efflux pump